ncbi:MAG TPA: mismatch-specific DNA-glycosylase [Gemmatimonadales bacterium]|nr:mismatch-specific DNA-glycosylase [Gemmatimonadales bacterium]
MRKTAKPPAKVPDLFHSKLVVVFCGLAARRRSAAPKQYYADDGNRFWSVLATTNLTPRHLAPSEYQLLPTFGIGLTDIIKTPRGKDVELRFGVVDRAGLHARILKFQPRFLCFNGKQAAQEFYDLATIDYGIQADPIDSTNVFVAPATSPAAGEDWDQGLWEDLAERLLRIRGPVG